MDPARETHRGFFLALICTILNQGDKTMGAARIYNVYNKSGQRLTGRLCLQAYLV